ncbi:MAG: sugar ABC transporter substrate-binding protein [Lachnospiraceae bacterium]|nr:sugar ABC transporter substrate-binding protein [Lachnospiraceae bacterium]
MLLAGCGASGSASGTSESGAADGKEAGATAVEAAADAADASGQDADGQKTIGMVIKHAQTEFIQAFVIGATDTCKKYGYELKVVDAQANTEQILNAIDNFITQDIDAFIMAGAEDLVSLVPGIERLNEEGIPVFALDTCPEGGKVEMFITNDIKESTAKAATQMIEGIKEAHGGEVPEGVLIEITGAQVDMYTADCHEGLMSVLDQYPQLEVKQGEGKWENEEAYARTSDLLSRYGDKVVGIYVHTPDIMGSGVVSAVENAGLNPADYFISGICIGKEGIGLLQEGKLYAVVEQPALDAAILAVEYIHDLFEGEPLPEIGETVEEEGALWSPAQVIENTYCDEGRTLLIQAPLIPQECDPSDPQLWENRIE